MSDIRTRPATKEYRDNWDKVFGAKKQRKLVSKNRFSYPKSDLAQIVNNALLDQRKATSADIRRRLKETP